MMFCSMQKIWQMVILSCREVLPNEYRLTNKYLQGIPSDSRAAKPHGFLQELAINENRIRQIGQLNEIARQRNQTMAQMALAWLLKDNRVTSVLIGASKPDQLSDCLLCLENIVFSETELEQIEQILN